MWLGCEWNDAFKQCTSSTRKCAYHGKPLGVQMTALKHANCLGHLASLDPPPYNDRGFAQWCSNAILLNSIPHSPPGAVEERSTSSDVTVTVYIYEFVSYTSSIAYHFTIPLSRTMSPQSALTLSGSDAQTWSTSPSANQPYYPGWVWRITIARNYRRISDTPFGCKHGLLVLRRRSWSHLLLERA